MTASKTPKRRPWLRIAIVTTLLLLPAGFGGWAFLTSRAMVAEVDRSMTLAAGYDRARIAAASMTAAQHHFQARSAVTDRAEFADAVARLRSSLRVIARAGNDSDKALVQGTTTRVDRYKRQSGRVFAAVVRGDARGARSLRRRDTEPSEALISEQLREGALRYRTQAVESLRDQRRAQNLELFGVVNFVVLGFLLVVAPSIRRRGAGGDASTGDLRRLERAALTDNLTALRNHRAFHEDLTREIERRNRLGGSFSLLMVDLDGLKQVNDTYGHQAGDERIRALADCLRRTKRESDIAYRVGGDEFTIILPGERAWGAFEYAQRLRAQSEADGFAIAVGITETSSYEAKDTICRRADLALIEAKRSNRSVVIYSQGLEPKLASGRNGEEHHQKMLATALARAVDAKDAGTRNHCETVSELCVMIGAELGLEPERLAKLRLAGLLHDVGKIGIADAILQKPDKLDEDESEVMRTHAQIGHNIISAAELNDEADWVLHHHERLDGTGYPSRLSGDEIPLESRIILVADTFEAITSDRPYREGRSREAAISELERFAGSQFDPACVEALRFALDIGPRAEADGASGADVIPLPSRTQAA
jgi:diguanylate cyclase (GGDEF)-like protein